MDGFQNIITEISRILQRKDPDIIWCFEKGTLREKERYEIEGEAYILSKEKGNWKRLCVYEEDGCIHLSKEITWGKQTNNEEEGLVLEIARDWILKKLKVIIEMVTCSYLQGESDALMEWRDLPDKKICRAVASLLPKMLQDEGFSFNLRAECIENGDGIVLSW